MNFPVVMHKDKHSDYGVSVPDLPGCVSAGSTVEEALAMIREAIELHVEGLIEEGFEIPLPTPIDELRADPNHAEATGATWAMVGVDPSMLRVRVKRINITMPQRVLEAIDRHARREGDTRSGLLLRAATRYIGREVGAFASNKRTGKKRKRGATGSETKARGDAGASRQPSRLRTMPTCVRRGTR